MKKTSTISVGQAGRVHEIEGERYNVHELARRILPDLFEDESHEEEDEEFLCAIEDALLTWFGVTHVVDIQDFGDEVPHPIEEFRAK